MVWHFYPLYRRLKYRPQNQESQWEKWRGKTAYFRSLYIMHNYRNWVHYTLRPPEFFQSMGGTYTPYTHTHTLMYLFNQKTSSDVIKTNHKITAYFIWYNMTYLTAKLLGIMWIFYIQFSKSYLRVQVQ